MISKYEKLRFIFVLLLKDENKREWDINKESFICEMEQNDIVVRQINDINDISQEIMESSLIITDSENMEADISDADVNYNGFAMAGYGMDYKGNCTFLITSFEDISSDYMRLVYDRKHGKPHVIGTTKRLIIREMTLDDLDGLYEVYDSIRDCKYIEPLYDRKKEEEFTKNYIKNMYGFFQYGLWIVVSKQDNRIIGRAGIENREIDGETVQELGYLLGRKWQKKGYAQEACRKILQYAFEELGLEKIFLCTDRQNVNSIKLAERLGFKKYASGENNMEVYNYTKNALLF